MVAEVRDDPAGRIRLAADTYAFGRGGSAVSALPAGGRRVHALAAGTGVLNPLDDDIRGSRWWRAVNEDLRASRSVSSVVRHGRTVITGVRE